MRVLAHLQDTLCKGKSKSQNRRSLAGETCKEGSQLSSKPERPVSSFSK